MNVYRPLQHTYKSQAFGDNKACARMMNALQPYRPFIIKGGTMQPNGTTVCPVGYNHFYGLMGLKGHNGEDWVAYNGQRLYFNVDANTKWYSKEASDSDGGIGVDVFSYSPIYFENLPDEAGPEARAYWRNHDKTIRVKFRYWHLKETWKDQDVEFGELIGYCDNTGASSGSHLHYSMKFVDENDNTLDSGNGFSGAVDFSAHYEDVFVLDVLKKKQEAMKLIEQLQELIARIRAFIASYYANK